MDEEENVCRPDWEEESLKRDNIDMHDKKQREHYVKACLEQMSEASKELDALGGEYNLVTSYLTDMEEIEAQPDEVEGTAKDLCHKDSGTGKQQGEARQEASHHEAGGLSSHGARRAIYARRVQ